MTRILGISGSLRRDSHNTSVLRAAAEAADPDVELELYDGLKEVPPYDEDDDVYPRTASVARLNAAIANADAVLFATPEYNASIPGQLKNAIDWISRPVATNVLRNKPVVVVGGAPAASGRPGRRPSSAKSWPRSARGCSMLSSLSRTLTPASKKAE
jgi:chromate reductase